jgi:hypothetical protein
MSEIATWAAIWSPPESTGSIELWEQGLILAGRCEDGVVGLRIPWRDIAGVERAGAGERVKTLPTLVLRLLDGRSISIAPLACGVLTMLERAVADHVRGRAIAQY